jgi:hypothetical protein
LARASASIRWFKDRSGAIACVKGIVSPAVSVAVTMGGESTHRRRTIKEN